MAFVEFGLRIGLHRIMKPSGGSVRPARKPYGRKVGGSEGLRCREPIGPGSCGDGKDGRTGKPFAMERFDGSPLSGLNGRQRIGKLVDGMVHGIGKPSGETVWRGAGPSGHAIQRAGTHGDGNGLPDRVAFEPPVRWDGGLRRRRINAGTPENDRFKRRHEGSIGARSKDPASRHLASPFFYLISSFGVPGRLDGASRDLVSRTT